MRRVQHIFHRRLIVVVLVFASMVGATSIPPSQAASSDSAVVAAYVPSSTNLSAAGCATGQANRTDFGPLLTGASAVTTLPCTIQFGSSNDTARLRMRQTDSLGVGMYQVTSGTLDATFGTAGKASAGVAPGAAADTAKDVAVQTDGKVIVGGSCSMGGATGLDFCLVRFGTNGVPDPAFNGTGRASTAIGAGVVNDVAHGVALQGDGRIVVGGNCDMGATGLDICVTRYNVNGSLDTSFDGDGIVTTPVSPTNGQDFGYDVAVQRDQRIVVAAHCAVNAGAGFETCVTRYNSDGSLDTSLSGTGKAIHEIIPGLGNDVPVAVAFDSADRIIVAGYCNVGGATGLDICVARLNSNGSIDTSFDGDGSVTTAVAPGTGTDYARDVAVQPDGRIVTAGYCTMGGATGLDGCLVRYNTNGSLDTTFDGDGIVTTAIAPGTSTDDFDALTILPDGRIMVTGNCDMGGATGVDICTARYRSNGALDTTFDVDGIATVSIAPGTGSEYGTGIAPATDGRIVVGGNCAMGGATGVDLCAAQLDSAGSLPQYVDTTTDWDTVGTGHFGACMTGVTSGTASWTTSATCPMTDGAYWNAIPTAATQIATATANTTNATANLRFGIRVAPGQTPGSYMAPITFDVIAP